MSWRQPGYNIRHVCSGSGVVVGGDVGWGGGCGDVGMRCLNPPFHPTTTQNYDYI